MLRFQSLTLLSVATLCVSAGAQGVSNTGLTRDYGVKLCGREFIRAVIFTCGGSRWRRSSDENSLQNVGDPFLERPYSDLSDKEGSLGWPRGLSVEGPKKTTLSLMDVLNVLGNLNDYESGAGLGFNEIDHVTDWQAEISQERNLNGPWSHPNRRKRNIFLGLAGMCCNLGCTKNDIGRLC